MQKVQRIAQLELGILFYSPIAWLLLAVFAVQSGIAYTEQLYAQETAQQLDRTLQALTKGVYAGENGLLMVVQQKLYLYIPLLTMGLLSREKGSGSIKLLLSSPVTSGQIVWGKFLAIMLYALLLVAILLLYVLAGYFSIIHLDVPFVLGGIFSLYLLLCAYAAIGLFMSSLTSYQVVAAISTLAVLAILSFVGTLGQDIDLVRELTYWLSMSGRVDNMVNGLISSRDVAYFLLVTLLFLTLTIMRLEAGRQGHAHFVRVLRYALVCLAFVLLIYLSSLPALLRHLDTTRFKDRTLSKASQDLIARFEEPISMTTYVNVAHYTAGYGAPRNRMLDKGQFEQYKRFMPGMKMDYISYYDAVEGYDYSTESLEEKTKKASEALGFSFERLLQPRQARELPYLEQEGNRLVRILHHRDSHVALRMFDDMLVYPREEEISVALKRLLDGPAVVGMLSGNGERSAATMGDRSYKLATTALHARNALINQGFDIIDLHLEDIAELPLHLSVLAWADPSAALEAPEVNKLLDYLEKGGNLLLAGEPGKQTLMAPVLDRLGLAFAPGMLLEENDNFAPDLLQARFTARASHYGFSFYDRAILTMPGATAILPKGERGFAIDTLLVSNGKTSWQRAALVNLDVEKAVFDPKTETKAGYPLAMALHRELADRTQKILVLGDADFMSNAELNRYSLNTVNNQFVTRIFRWFSDGKYPFQVMRPPSIDTSILVSREQINGQKVVFLGVFPLIMIFWGSILLLRRKRQ